MDTERIDTPDSDDESGVLEASDSLLDRGVSDVADEGWSAPERPYAVEDWGTTESEEAAGEPLSGRLARELTEDTDDDGDGLGDTAGTDGELRDGEVGDRRAGRLTSTDGDDLTGEDAGIDGAAASAEEAAVHVIGD